MDHGKLLNLNRIAIVMSPADTPAQQTFTIVIPVHNEAAVLPTTFDRLVAMEDRFAQLGLTPELIFINDGSRDRSGELLDQIAKRCDHARVIHLARNFGHQAAVCAGLDFATGDVVAIIDADLQDPPEHLPAMLEKWREGYQVVYAVRKKRKENPVKVFAYWIFYRLYRALSDIEMPLDAGDFCILDRHAVDLLNSLPERQRFVRGLRSWIGLKQIGVEYERAARHAGEPSYTFGALVKLAVDGLVSFSTVPLRLVTRLGLLCILLAFGIGIWVVTVTVMAWLNGVQRDAPGWASLACLVLLLSAVQMLSLGVIGEYLTRVFLEVKGRPTYLVGRVTGDKTQHAAEEPPHNAEQPPHDGI